MPSVGADSCRDRSAAYTCKLNAAGAEILENGIRGTHGHHVILAAVGFSKRRSRLKYRKACSPAHGPPALHELAPGGRQDCKDSVPGILMVEYNGANASWHFTIMELEYCRNTDNSSTATCGGSALQPARK